MKIKLFIICILLMSCQTKTDILPVKIVVDKYHGQLIEDPYRYLENLENPTVKHWIDQQNDISYNFLRAINKRQELVDKQIQFDSNKSFTISKLKVTKNNKYFYLKRSSTDNTPKLYYRESYEEPEIMLYNPKDYKSNADSEFVINYIAPNWDGTKIVISLTKMGKEISDLIIYDVLSKTVSSKVISNVWPTSSGGIHWLPDNSGFMYLQYINSDPESKQFSLNTKSVIYKLGADPKQLKELLSKSHNPKLNLKEQETPIISFNDKNDKYIIGKIRGNRSYYDAYSLKISELDGKNWKTLFKVSDKIKDYMVKGDSLVYITSKNAPNFKICSTSIINPDFDNPKTLVEEKKDLVITDFSLTSEGLYFVTSKNGVKASLFKLENNSQKEITLPKVYGNISLNSRGLDYPELWINASGWTTDNKRFEYFNEQLLDKDINAALEDQRFKDIIVEEIEITAHDGEKIPLSLFYNKKIKKTGKNKVLMDGYGAYGRSMKPSLQIRRLLWVLEGGIYAVAHVRGGGEKGDAWHKGGQKVTKPNTWKDFITCAEYLIENDITTREQLAIWSGSAGGIMIGRAITERPDLFTAAIIEFGMLNTLRSENRANGAKNIKEYGTVKNPEEFKALLEMDAYHNLKQGEKYPATLLTAGLNDPRVPAWFSIKFAARIQAYNESNTNNLLLIDKKAGHGKDDTKTKEFERFANILSFAFWQTGHPDYQPE
ncbi:prolyl oligopeptidase family serine peptidase [Aquimarina sp. M1]